MAQLNMHVSPAFERALSRYMRARGIRTKSEAIRRAVEDGLDRIRRSARSADFAEWIGLGSRAPQNPAPRFPSDDALWE